MEILLNREKMQKWHQISDAIKDDKLNQIIKQSELQDLKPLLGRELFYLIKKTPADYLDILEEKSGEHQGTQYDHSGLEEVLSYFVYGRLIMYGDVINNPFGFTRKLTKEGENLSYQDKKNINKEMKDIAFNLWLEVRYYMTLTDKPYFSVCKTKPTKVGGFKITKI